jgi:hypothetical protein
VFAAPAVFRQIIAIAAGLCLLACGDGEGQPIREAVVSPSSTYCKDVATWSASDVTAEETLLTVLGALRSVLTCSEGNLGGFGGMPSLPSQVGALSSSPELRCSARRHARDLAQQTTPAGETLEGRIRLAGYASSVVAELIALDQPEVDQALVQLLVVSAGCDTLIDPRMVAVGVGKFQNMWTVDLAGARSP